jgi:DNA-binding transcriptional LysR family regulator
MFDAYLIRNHDMPRILDLTSLRSFATVAEAGGVTRAAGALNLTQSAVSMQLKRLEESLDLRLLDRSGRGVTLTPAGEQLLSYARRMLQLNDEAWARLSARDQAGEITLGVPCDLLYPVIPQVLRRFARDFPRVKVNLICSYTRMLRTSLERGDADVILTTEDRPDPGAETVAVSPLRWIGAPGGQAWTQRPLRIAFSANCIFRQGVQRRLDAAGIPWEMAIETSSDSSVDATVSADLAVHARIDGADGDGRFELIDHGGQLPDLWSVHINLYAREAARTPAQGELVDLIRRGYAEAGAPRQRQSPVNARIVAA